MTSTVVTPNIFCHFPPRLRKPAGNDESSTITPTILFFITGNPGVIGYYHEFLHLLLRRPLDYHRHQHRDTSLPSPTTATSAATDTVIADRCVVVGYSLGGFEQQEENDNDDDDDEKEEDAAARYKGTRPSSTSKERLTLHVNSLWEDSSSSPPLEGSGTRSENHDDRIKVDISDLMIGPADLQQPSKERDSDSRGTALCGLREQIELCYTRLEAVVDKVRSVYGNNSHKVSTSSFCLGTDAKGIAVEPVRVVLIGHSAGTYISLEVVKMAHDRRHRHLYKQQQQSQTQHPQDSMTEATTSSTSSFTVATVILLTPTIQDIALSPSGRRITSAMSVLPFLPSLAQFGVSTLTSVLPKSTLRWIVMKASGMKETTKDKVVDDTEGTSTIAAPASSLDAAVRFISSPKALKQTLFLAKEEMEQIGENDWAEEVWGFNNKDDDVKEARAVEEATSPRLFLWYAKRDNWVADTTREEVLRMVNSKSQNLDGKASSNYRKPEILVDTEDGGIVHDWSVAHSEIVAEKVGVWLSDVLA